MAYNYYAHVCEQARWARSAGNSAIEDACIVIFMSQHPLFSWRHSKERSLCDTWSQTRSLCTRRTHEADRRMKKSVLYLWTTDITLPQQLHGRPPKGKRKKEKKRATGCPGNKENVQMIPFARLNSIGCVIQRKYVPFFNCLFFIVLNHVGLLFSSEERKKCLLYT